LLRRLTGQISYAVVSEIERLNGTRCSNTGAYGYIVKDSIIKWRLWELGAFDRLPSGTRGA
jgi:hypothetical protein